MITVYYCYKRKRDGKWCHSFKEFTNRQKALRFMKSIDDPKKESFVTDFGCDDPLDTEWLYKRHVLSHPSIRGKTI